MLKIRKMSPEDIGFAIKLTDTQEWGLVEDDFKFAMKLEPEGCFILTENSERIGLVTNVGFDEIGWLGNLVVDESHRRKGAGAKLVKHSIAYLRSRDLKTVGIYAYQDVTEFYGKIGFIKSEEFVVLKGKPRCPPPTAEPEKVRKQNLGEIAGFDCVYFGASRKRLLQAILFDPNNFGYLLRENGRIIGYGAESVYRDSAEIGPLVCLKNRQDVAINLLKAMLSRLENSEASICIPAKEPRIIKFLLSAGLVESMRVTRMFYKPPALKECVYVTESLERG